MGALGSTWPRWALAFTVLVAPARARAECRAGEATRIIPLPIWATDPNQGSTWGVMPVFVRICPDDQRTRWVFAPSVSWNSVIHVTGTVRLFAYPSLDTTLTVIAGASTRINHRLIISRQRLPAATGEWTDESTLRIEADAFARFFGLGPHSAKAGEATYTAYRAQASHRRGANLGDHLNLGGSIGFDREDVGARGVVGLPLAPIVYADVPGMQRPSLVFWQGLDLRYDDRVGGDYADHGMRLDAGAAVAWGLQGSPSFVRTTVDGRWLWRELSRVSGAARVVYTGETAADAPFYHQSTLGGAFVLRGFAAGRFYARQAWTAEIEQRIRAVRTHLFGVVADWRVDPFVTAGQVFDRAEDAFVKPQLAIGVGLRVFVHPNLLARVDLASGGDGLQAYVELGYPY